MKIAVLAVQGAFAEHRKKIEDLGIECMELRKKEDLMKPFDGLILLSASPKSLAPHTNGTWNLRLLI